jgi:hypothetical protein
VKVSSEIEIMYGSFVDRSDLIVNLFIDEVSNNTDFKTLCEQSAKRFEKDKFQSESKFWKKSDLLRLKSGKYTKLKGYEKNGAVLTNKGVLSYVDIENNISSDLRGFV